MIYYIIVLLSSVLIQYWLSDDVKPSVARNVQEARPFCPQKHFFKSRNIFTPPKEVSIKNLYSCTLFTRPEFIS